MASIDSSWSRELQRCLNECRARNALKLRCSGTILWRIVTKQLQEPLRLLCAIQRRSELKTAHYKEWKLEAFIVLNITGFFVRCAKLTPTILCPRLQSPEFRFYILLVDAFNFLGTIIIPWMTPCTCTVPYRPVKYPFQRRIKVPVTTLKLFDLGITNLKLRVLSL